MRFKMAEKSLFAILLRSPWWISLLLACAFVGSARALLPQEYWVAGALGAVPLLVIAGIAFWRQMRAPSAAQVQALLDEATGLKPRELVGRLSTAWASRGMTVQPAGHTGADLLLEKAGTRTVVAVRRWKLNQHGVEPLRELLAARQATGADVCLYFARGELSAPARQLAREESIQLAGEAELVALLR